MPTELFANNATTTVSSGGTTAPAAGTTETWTVASSTGFPAASSTANPSRQFTVVDSAAQSEIVRVINVSGTTWTVVRGVEGTTPVAHTAGFTVAAIVTQWGLTQPSLGVDLEALRTWYAALADVANNPADILVIGDSIVEGANSTTLDNRWVDQMRDQIRATYPVQGVPGGPNYLPGYYVGSSLPDQAVTAGTPGAAGFGLGWRSYVLNTSAHSLTFTVTGTSARVWWVGGGGTGVGSYQVDGGSVVTFSTTQGALLDNGSTTITFASRGTHTVVLKWSSGGDVYIEGLAVFDGDETKGVRVWEAGWYGVTSQGMYDTVQANTPGWERYGVIQADLVLIALGTNDLVSSIASSVTKASIKNIIAKIKSVHTVTPSFVLVAYPQRDITSATTVEPWGNYVQAMFEIAAEDSSVAVLDMTTRMPAVLGDVLGLYSDAVHPTNKGQISIGAAVANFVTEDRKPSAANFVRTKTLGLTSSTNATAASGDLWFDATPLTTTAPGLLKAHDGLKAVALNGWEPLYSGSLTAAATTLASGTLPARDELMIVVRIVSLSAADIPALRFNGDTAANYWSRYITAATGAVTLTNAQTASGTMARLSGLSVTNGRTFNIITSNRLASTKLATVDAATGSGAAATIPATDITGSFEWINTAAQITSVTLLTAGGTATMGIGSGFAVYGRNL